MPLSSPFNVYAEVIIVNDFTIMKSLLCPIELQVVDGRGFAECSGIAKAI